MHIYIYICGKNVKKGKLMIKFRIAITFEKNWEINYEAILKKVKVLALFY